jgi:esterase
MLQLFFRKIEAQTPTSHPPMAILHGLFGSGRNWLSVAKDLSQARSVYLIDQRNHGQSPHHSDMNHALLGADLHHWHESQAIKDWGLIGHSLGGQVAMHYVFHFRPASLKYLIIVDIAPKAYNPQRFEFVSALKSLDLQALKSRSEADTLLQAAIPDSDTRQFLLSNLTRNSNTGFAWQINLDALLAAIPTISQNPLKDCPTHLPPWKACPVLFIRGENSDYISPEDELQIKTLFPEAEIASIPQAGHWVHFEQADLFLQKVQSFLEKHAC